MFRVAWITSVAFISPFSSELAAQERSTFVIAAQPGYGVEDCLTDREECGRLVANAWCEGQGHGIALSFGRSDNDQDANVGRPELRPVFITCGD